LDELPAGNQEVTSESAEVTAESVSEEQSAAAQTSAPDHATDSWFENVEGASVIESTKFSSEEFWLPPELPQVYSREETSAPVDALQEAVPEAGAPVESHEEADSFAVASASQPKEHVEPENSRLDATDGAGEDAAVVESPAEVSMAAALPAPDDSEQMEEPRAIESADFVAYDADYAAVEATIVTPADTNALIGHTPSFDDAVVTPPPAPFVTETLAELYLQQGFRDEALAIYRQLAERDPSDQTLQRRIESIERAIYRKQHQRPMLRRRIALHHSRYGPSSRGSLDGPRRPRVPCRTLRSRARRCRLRQRRPPWQTCLPRQNRQPRMRVRPRHWPVRSRIQRVDPRVLPMGSCHSTISFAMFRPADRQAGE
jgi:hypothetical protein